MGVVYLGLDPENRTVAVKVLRSQVAGDQTARRRLVREVETMRRVHSRYVAEVVDADVTGETPYIATQFVQGRPLDDVVGERGPRTGTELGRLATGLAGALAEIHAAGIIHRDLKPGNVLLSGGDPVVIDFGIAQAVDTTRLTQTGMFIGTPGYLAPEVIHDDIIGPPSDVHAWAATMIYAATGHPPYGSGGFEHIFYRIVQGQPDLTGMPAELLPVVQAALAREPRARPTAAALVQRLRTLDFAAMAPAPPSGGAATTAPAGEHPYRPAAGAAAAGLGAAGAQAADAPTAALGETAVAPANTPGPPPHATRAYTERQAPDNYADVLPPVQYPPANRAPVASAPPGGYPGQDDPRRAPPGARAADTPGRADRDRRTPGWHPLLTLLCGITAVGATIVFPTVAMIVVLLTLVVLRAADRASSRLAVRRGARGPRSSDPVLVALGTPWGLVRGALIQMLLTPLNALVALLVFAGLVYVAPDASTNSLTGIAAGAFTAMCCVGLGTGAPRRQVNRMVGFVARGTPGTAAVAIVLSVVALLSVTGALTQPSVWQPVHMAQDSPNEIAAQGRAHVKHEATGWVSDRIHHVVDSVTDLLP